MSDKLDCISGGICQQGFMNNYKLKQLLFILWKNDFVLFTGPYFSSLSLESE